MKLKLLILILALQTAWILGTTFIQERALTNGKVVLLETRPVDPRDLLRGDYLTLNYKISDVPLLGDAIRLGARVMESKRVARSVLAGSPRDITDQIRAYVDAGATHIIMNLQPPYDPKLLRRFSTEVMPNFR